MADLLENKVCIITGSTRGIGKETALLFAREGAIVVVNGSGNSTAEEWIKASDVKERLFPYYFDVTEPKAIHENIIKIKKQFGHVDVLVNNAGIESNELIGMISRDKMEEMFKVNVYGPIEMIQGVSRIMSRNDKGGCIINISSIVGLKGNPGQLVYSATKGAVVALTKTAAKELAKNNIRVNAIAPGLTQTEMMDTVDKKAIESRIKNICLGRVAQPIDIAGVCLLLASDYASYISGQVIVADGCSII